MCAVISDIWKVISVATVYWDREISLILTILRLYEQQEYMYKNKLHTVPDRIVSISQP